MVKELLDSGELERLSYRYKVKPRSLRDTPVCTNAVFIQDKTTDPPTYYFESNLPAIPLRHLQLSARQGQVLLRQDSTTTLSEIKKFHTRKLKALNYDPEAISQQWQCLDMGYDGVQESGHGSRNLLVVAARFGGASGPIYPWKILNPLIGNSDAKATADDILR